MRPYSALVERRGLTLVGAFLLVGSTLAAAQNWATFVNETASRLVGEPSVTTSDPEEKSYAIGDVDQDGDLDLVVARKVPFTVAGGRRNVLFMNEGIAEGHAKNGVLVDRTAQYAPKLLDTTMDRDVILVDVTGDGWLDIITATTLGVGLPKSFSHPRVYVNLGNDPNGNWLGFRYDAGDVDRIPTFPTPPAFASVTAGDIDGDGDIDLYFTDYSASVASNPNYQGLQPLNDRLLINNGSGFFTDESSLRMTSEMLQSAFGTSSVIADMNGDNRKDVVKDTALFFPQRISVSYNSVANHGYFDRFSVIYSSAPYFVQVADLNNDNRMDVIAVDDGTDRYLLNTGNNAQGMAVFTTIAFSGDDGFGGNAYAEDLNNDGFRDVLITDVDIDIAGCNRRMHIYRNLGNTPNVSLVEQGTLGIGAANLQGTHDVAVFDINGDGWKDLVIGRCNTTAVWMNQPPAGLIFAYPDGLPSMVPVNESTTFRVAVTPIGGAQHVAGSGKIFVSVGQQPFVSSSMTYLGNNTYEATLPALPCAGRLRFYVSGDAVGGGTYYDPSNAPASSYRVVAAAGLSIDRDEIEGDVGEWSVENGAGLTYGAWEQAIPNGTAVPGGLAAPDQDATAGPGVMAFVTGNGPPGGPASQYDVDGGPTRLISPVIDLEGTDADISYARWFFCDDEGVTGQDWLVTEISNNGGASWVFVQRTSGTAQNWETVTFTVSDYVVPTANVRVRFTTDDTPNNSITEGGIDNFEVRKLICGSPCPGDIDGDGYIGQADLGLLLSSFAKCQGDPGFDPDADIDGDGCVGQSDLGLLLGDFGQSCP
ncbi:MAG: FG-GAP-like repeat-containing protein [Phycisphaerae bacterium]|nr:VCBS repeat-containing protein [Phycisphaerae bacterium]MCZ2401102.1 FG-GAP-like repeat-containing protein [Phycisphaerae bacterium]